MRKLIVAAVVLAACTSSAPKGPKADIPAPEFQIVQVVGPSQLTFEEGNIEVQYRVTIRNRAQVPMTLRRIELRTVNPAGGAYTLVPRSYYFKEEIPPGQERSLTFWAKAVGYGRSTRDSEPVTVRGVAYFETPAGYYNHIFGAELAQ